VVQIHDASSWHEISLHLGSGSHPMSPRNIFQSLSSLSKNPTVREPSVISSPVNILLVDDEPRNLDVLEGLLQSPEYRLVRATKAEDALLALLNEEFAVIVLDVQMPGTDGIELAHLIKQRERTQHIPIIFLTAFYNDERRMLESYNVGAVDYLTKPAKPQVLRSKVAVFVDLFRKTEALRKINMALELEVAQRSAAERALRETNDALESRVEARTVALREARDAAERSGRAKDSFLAALSHELRTPLNPVLLLASEAAENPVFPVEARAQFLTIRKNVELEARLIDDLLDLTKLTHGKMSIDRQPVDIHRVLEDAISTVQAEIEQKQIVLRLNLATAGRNVSGDAVRLQQVFWNVLKNAVKFTPTEGIITVVTKVDERANSVAIEVIDNGIGLSAAEIERIYDAFAQGDHVATGGAHRFGGLGLGLTISRGLVEQHGGRLIAKSEGHGKGAAFVIELPLTHEEPAMKGVAPGGQSSPAAISASPSEPARHRQAVLLVEDHDPSRMALATLLKARHFEVSIAASLADARALTARHHFDFLISDIGLPDGTGFDLMKEMKIHGNVRGIALTGYGMEEDVDRSREAGFLVHLTKPIVAQSLDKALAKLST
jgi:signal transduction histidine kinase